MNNLKVITTTIFKGGCGVTTISKALIEYFSQQGYQLLVIDLNENTHLFNCFFTENRKDKNKCLESVVDRNNDSNSASESLFLKSNIVYCEENVDALFVDEFSLMRASSNESTNSEMKDFFTSVADEYDIVIIDTPPAINFSMRAAIECSTSILIPIVAGESEIHGANTVIKLCEGINKNRKKGDLIKISVVNNKVGKVSRFDKAFFLKIQSDPVISKYLSPLYLSNLVGYKKILDEKKSIFDTAGKNKAREQLTEFCQFILEDLLSKSK